MATVSQGVNPTLRDLASTKDPDGMSAQVARLMDQRNPLIRLLTVIEGNLPSGHRSTISAGLPEGVWRRLYQGVQPSTGKRVQVNDTCGSLNSYSEVDKLLADMSGDAGAFIEMENRDHIEGMAIQIEKALIYGSEKTDPAQFTGLSPRYGDKSAGNGRYIIDAGGTETDNASIWLVVASPETITGITPKGSKAGIQVTPKGVVSVQTGTGAGQGKFEAYVVHYEARIGLAVRDYRFGCRVANIDKSALKADAASGADIPDLMFQAMMRVQNLSEGHPFFLMNEDTATMLGRQVSRKVSESTLSMENVGGTLMQTFQKIPVAISDAMDGDEARVT